MLLYDKALKTVKKQEAHQLRLTALRLLTFACIAIYSVVEETRSRRVRDSPI